MSSVEKNIAYIVRKGFENELLDECIKSPEDIEELRKTVDLWVSPRCKNENTYCSKCKRHRVIVKKFYVCDICGEATYGSTNEFIPNIWLHVKSRHSRRRWITKYIKNLVEPKYVDVMVDDFMKVVSEMSRRNLIPGKNISRYGYYVIRLASRRGIALGKVTDIKNRKVFDDRLFGSISVTWLGQL